MFGLGTTELVVIGLIVLLLFGTTRLPALGRSLGSFITEFKTGIKTGGQEQEENHTEASETSEVK
jgi:TatA/E family protein of Tat protein translocase